MFPWSVPWSFSMHAATPPVRRRLDWFAGMQALGDRGGMAVNEPVASPKLEAMELATPRAVDGFSLDSRSSSVEARNSSASSNAAGAPKATRADGSLGHLQSLGSSACEHCRSYSGVTSDGGWGRSITVSPVRRSASCRFIPSRRHWAAYRQTASHALRSRCCMTSGCRR
jgi:hypothetical protein